MFEQLSTVPYYTDSVKSKGGTVAETFIHDLLLIRVVVAGTEEDKLLITITRRFRIITMEQFIEIKRGQWEQQKKKKMKMVEWKWS